MKRNVIEWVAAIAMAATFWAVIFTAMMIAYPGK